MRTEKLTMFLCIIDSTSYTLMNQWTNYSKPTGQAAVLARDKILGSVYRVVELPPTQKQRDITSRQQRLLGDSESNTITSPIGSRKFPLPGSRPDRSLYYRGSLGSAASQVSQTDGPSRRATADPYGVC